MRWGAAPAGLDRDALLAAVTEGLAGLGHGAGAVVACSGGPDSTALAHLCAEARPDLRLRVAHVRHGLRDDAADAEVAAAHAAALGLPYDEREVAVANRGEGLEAAAREARYAALARLARNAGAGVILVGHTADDRAETVVLNLARGTGIRGLGGIAPERRESGDLRVVRPLLRLRRDDVRGFVDGEGLDAVADPTNRDDDQRRRRAREEVLPALARLSGGPGDPVGVLNRLADLATDDAEALDELAASAARDLVARWGPGRAVRTADLDALPSALTSRVVRLALAGVRGGAQGLGADAVAAVLGLDAGQACHVGGGAWVTRGGGWLAVAPVGQPGLPVRPLALPGAVDLPELDLRLHADWPWGEGREAPGQTALDLGGSAAPRVGEVEPPPGPLGPVPPRAGAPGAAWTVLPAGLTPAAVRARRDGDRLALPGGARKLQDVLVDARVPRALRDLVPVVVDADDAPLWVAGVAVRRHDADALAGCRLWLAASAFPAAAAGGYAAAP